MLAGCCHSVARAVPCICDVRARAWLRVLVLGFAALDAGRQLQQRGGAAAAIRAAAADAPAAAVGGSNVDGFGLSLTETGEPKFACCVTSWVTASRSAVGPGL